MLGLNVKVVAYGIAINIMLSSFLVSANAADIWIDGGIVTRAVVSATKGQDMDFGYVDYDPIHAGQIQLGTDGSVQLGGGASGVSLNGGTPTAGDITLSGDGQSTIQISCESSGVLGAGGVSTLNLQNVEFAIDTGQVYGSGTPCAGLSSSSATIDLASNNAPQIFFGGALDLSGNAITRSDHYSTANAGGDPVTVRIVYQ